MPVKATYPSQIDFGSLYAEDFKKAQARFERGLNAGYDEGTADALYLDPMRKKWAIIQANPGEFQDTAKLDKINSDFEDATASAVKNLQKTDFNQYRTKTGDIFETAGPSVSARFAPAVASWAVSSVKPEMTFEEQETIKNLGQEINRLKSKRGTYTRELTNAQLDRDSRAAKMTAVNDINGQLQDLQAEYEQALRGPVKAPAQPEPVQSPFQTQAGFDRPTVPENIVGYTGDVPIPTEEQPEPAAPAKPKPVMFISGRPDLSNVSREEADAAWAARFGRNQRPTPVDREEVESPAAKAYDTAAQVRADFKAGNLSRDKAIQILRDQFGLE